MPAAVTIENVETTFQTAKVNFKLAEGDWNYYIVSFIYIFILSVFLILVLFSSHLYFLTVSFYSSYNIYKVNKIFYKNSSKLFLKVN